ncbi:MAG: hypothetical protein JO107_16605 [Hyphomicrobiales bacterium]|nr:hypothetical protein [Hyphomicrobiales bacterium]MBV8664710.1 hypothetical protein [Hyphomicrobiales bacterium]
MSEPLCDRIVALRTRAPHLSSGKIAAALGCRPEYVRVALKRRHMPMTMQPPIVSEAVRRAILASLAGFQAEAAQRYRVSPQQVAVVLVKELRRQLAETAA